MKGPNLLPGENMPEKSNEIKIIKLIHEFYDELNKKIYIYNFGEGKINIAITGTQKINSLELSNDLLGRYKKWEIEELLIKALNFAIQDSIDHGNKELKVFTKYLDISANDKERLIDSEKIVNHGNKINQIVQKIISEIYSTSSENKEIIISILGGRNIVSVKLSNELLKKNDNKIIGQLLLETVNNSIEKSRISIREKLEIIGQE